MVPSRGPCFQIGRVGSLLSSLDVCTQYGWMGSLAAFFAAADGNSQGLADLTGYLLTRKLTESAIRSAEGSREIRFRI